MSFSWTITSFVPFLSQDLLHLHQVLNVTGHKIDKYSQGTFYYTFLSFNIQ